MKHRRLGLCILIALASAVFWPAAGQRRQPVQAMVTVCFVPPDDCSALIMEAIGSARSRIRIAAYELTSGPIVVALVGAHNRGVDVEALLDRANLRPVGRRPGSAAILAAAGVPVWIDHPNGIAHNKFIVVDDGLVIGGSFNYTASAQIRNAENMTLTRSADLAAAYVSCWTDRRAVSQRYLGE